MIFTQIFFYRVVAARLDGTLDFLEIETFHNPIIPTSTPSNSPHIKGKSVIPVIHDSFGNLDLIHVYLNRIHIV